MGPPAKCTFPANATQLLYARRKPDDPEHPACLDLLDHPDHRLRQPQQPQQPEQPQQPQQRRWRQSDHEDRARVGIGRVRQAGSRSWSPSNRPRSFTLTCCVTCRPRVTAGIARKAQVYRALGQLVGSGSNAGVNHLQLVKVHGKKLKPGKYELLISAGGKTYVLKFKVRSLTAALRAELAAGRVERRDRRVATAAPERDRRLEPGSARDRTGRFQRTSSARRAAGRHPARLSWRRSSSRVQVTVDDRGVGCDVRQRACRSAGDRPRYDCCWGGIRRSASTRPSGVNWVTYGSDPHPTSTSPLGSVWTLPIDDEGQGRLRM